MAKKKKNRWSVTSSTGKKTSFIVDDSNVYAFTFYKTKKGKKKAFMTKKSIIDADSAQYFLKRMSERNKYLSKK